MKLFRRKKKDIDHPLKLIHTDRKGNKFYAFDPPLLVPGVRAVSGERAARFADMKVTEATLRDAFAEMKASAKKQEWAKLFALVEQLNIRLALNTEEDSLLELAACYVLIEGEDPEEPNVATNQRKVQLWKEDSQARSFFLRWAYDLTQKSSGLQGSDILTYLDQTAAAAEMLVKFLKSSKAS